MFFNTSQNLTMNLNKFFNVFFIRSKNYEIIVYNANIDADDSKYTKVNDMTELSKEPIEKL